jgi:WD40 repeat protein
VRLRHGDAVPSIAFSPNGSVIASGSIDGSVSLWEVVSGKEIRRCLGHDGWVDSIAFSPTGKLLASGGYDRTIRLWEVATGKMLLRLTGHQLPISSIAFSPDGKSLASCSWGKSIRIWAVASGKQVTILHGHEKHMYSVTFSPDGKILASRSEDQTVRLWEVSTGKELHQLEAGLGGRQAAFSPNGKTLAFGSWASHVHLVDVATGKLIRKIGSRHYVDFVAFSPDGKALASAGRGFLYLWNMNTGKAIHDFALPRGGTGPIAFSPDGKWIASGGEDGLVRFWDPVTGKERPPPPGHEHAVTSVALSPDGQTVASASLDGTIRLWAAATGNEIYKMKRPPDRNLRVTFCPTGNLLVGAGQRREGGPVDADRKIQLWDPNTGKECGQLQEDQLDVCSLAFTADGRTLVSGSQDKRIHFWDLASRKLIRTFTSQPHGLSFIALSPDGGRLASGNIAEKVIILWDTKTGKEVRKFPHLAQVCCAAFSPDGKSLATASNDSGVYLWDVPTGKQRCSFQGHKWASLAIVFSPDGKAVASAGQDNRILVWEVVTGTQRRQLGGHRGYITSLAFSPDGTRLLSGSMDTTCLLWDLADLQQPVKRQPLTAKQLENLWIQLQSDDAAKAYDAICQLAAVPKQSVAFLDSRLKPMSPADPKRLVQLLADLDSPLFATRAKASKELASLQELAEPALRKALTAKQSLEVRLRIEGVLAKLEGILRTPDRLREVRALEVLEHAGVSEAREVLKKLSQGAPAAWTTQEAIAALKRLNRLDSLKLLKSP